MRLVVLVSGIAAAIGLAGAAVAQNAPADGARLAQATGGSMSGGAAPIVDGGQIIVASGYGHAMKMPGNVLLVFEKQ